MHAALICPPFPSHRRVFETLAAGLGARGHCVTLVEEDGGRVVPVSCTRAGEVSAARRPATGLFATLAEGAARTDRLCRQGPDLLRRIGADMVIGDQMEPAAGLLARHLGLRAVSVACALPIERDEGIPLPFLGWPYDPSANGLSRNRGGERVAWLILHRQRAMIRLWGDRFGLDPRPRDLQDCLSPDLTIAQTVAEFDFPRPVSAARLLAVGPIRPVPPPDVPAPDTRPDTLPADIVPDPARPFVYLSFGTLQGNRSALFRRLVRAADRLGAQTLVAHCGALSSRDAGSLGATWARDFVPQRAALARADVCVTHGGLNTALESLCEGVPLLVLPMGYDQPGVAARIAHHGVGLRASPRGLTTGRAEALLRRLLAEDRFRARARALGAKVRAGGGIDAAIAAIESAACSAQPKAPRALSRPVA